MVFTATLPVWSQQQRCCSKVAGEGFPCTSEDGLRILLGGRLVFEAQFLPGPISGRCRSLLSCLTPVVSPSGLGHGRAAEFRHAQRCARGDPIGGPARWVAAFHVRSRDAHASSGRRYMGRLLHVLRARRRGRLHEARQRACLCALVFVVRLLLLANPTQSTPPLDSAVRSSPSRRPRTRQHCDRTLHRWPWPCVSISPHSQPAEHRIISSERPPPPACDSRANYGSRDGDADADGSRAPAARGRRRAEPHRPHPHRVLSLPHGKPCPPCTLHASSTPHPALTRPAQDEMRPRAAPVRALRAHQLALRVLRPHQGAQDPPQLRRAPAAQGARPREAAGRPRARRRRARR
jgi:hypothetical protein